MSALAYQRSTVRSGPAVRRQVKRYSAASLPVRLDVPAADPVHGGVRLEYRYDGAGQRVSEVAQALLGVDKGDPDPYYQKRVWLRHGDGRAAGVLDGDGRLVSWSLYGAGLAGRIEPGQDTPPEAAEATERAAADSAQAALGRYAVEGALAEANQVHALGLSEAQVKQAAAEAVQAAEAETRAAAEGSVSIAALASHDEIGGAYVAEAEAPLREALYTELVVLGVPEAAALTAATEAAKGAAAEGGTAAGLAVKPGGVAGYRWRYYHADHLGSVRAVTDGYGRVVEATDYYVFGLQMPGRVWRSDSETREGYTGHELDPETGLSYAGLRYYPSALGRWLAPDPAGQYASPYDYVGGDPVNMIDPDGAYGVKYDKRYERFRITRVRSGTMNLMNGWDRFPGAAITSGFMRYNRRSDSATYKSHERQNASWAPVQGMLMTGSFILGAGRGGGPGGAGGWAAGAGGDGVSDAFGSSASADQVHMDRVAFQVMGWLRVDGSLNLSGSHSEVFNVMAPSAQAGSASMLVSHQMQQAFGSQTGTVVSAILNAIIARIFRYAKDTGSDLSEQSSQDAALNHLLQNWDSVQGDVVEAVGESAGAGGSGGGSGGRSRAEVTMCRAQNDSGC